jgi:spoIIIJ-associated protein
VNSLTAQIAKQRLEEVISFLGVNVDAQAEVTEDGIELTVAATPATPRLIGHRGETLRAIEYLVSQMIKRQEPDAPRILVDIAGYKQARRRTLEDLAHEVATKVIEAGQAEELAPMNPAERRIVHMTLRTIPGVHSESTGTGKGRRITVSPAPGQPAEAATPESEPATE